MIISKKVPLLHFVRMFFEGDYNSCIPIDSNNQITVPKEILIVLIFYIFFMYLKLLVSITISSPSLINGGTWIVKSFSSIAGL